MKILIVSATESEVRPLLEKLGKPERDSRFFYKGIEVRIVITGVGMTKTAFHLGKVVSEQWDMAFNMGLAGSFNENLEIGSVVNIVQDHFSEMGAEDGDDFIKLSQLNLGASSEVFNESVMQNRILEEIPKVCGITVNRVHGSPQSIEKVFQQYHPNTESMEGAAFLMCCKEAGIPCAQIRAISNVVERRNKDAWNIPLAIDNLNKKAVEILEAFTSTPLSETQNN